MLALRRHSASGVYEASRLGSGEACMFSMTEKALSRRAEKQLTEHATYHGSLTRLRLGMMTRMTGVFAGLLLGIACITLSVFWLLDDLTDLQRRLPSVVWAVGFMYVLSLIESVWDSRYSHEALCERKKFAQAVLKDGRASEALVEFEETAFALPHEHGTLYFIDDGQGGSVLLDVSTIADDPREPQARQSRISTRWRLDCVAGQVQAARFSGEKIPIRRVDGLNDCGESRPEGILEALGFPGPQDLARVPLSIGEVEQRVRALLRSSLHGV